MLRTGLVLIAWIALTTAAFAIDITRCGQRVGRSEIGELMVDLDCPGYPGTCNADPTTSCMADVDCPSTPTAAGCNTGAPFVEGGTLRLNGHTLSSHDPNLSRRSAVHVARRGAIQGPGTITAQNGIAVWFTGKRLTISDVEIRDSHTGIKAAFGGKVRATNLAAHDLLGPALSNGDVLRGEGITVTRCGLDGSQLPANPDLQAIFRSALIATRTSVQGLVASDNGGAAVLAAKVRIDGGTLAGNAAGLGDWDILTAKRPRLVDATCHRSGLVVNEGGPLAIVPAPWTACAGD
jgi:hypothetical protein